MRHEGDSVLAEYIDLLVFVDTILLSVLLHGETKGLTHHIVEGDY